ncbi:SET domain [Trinorchestia longiramus]|nr:SET domain [Trinorchestia longiramus]
MAERDMDSQLESAADCSLALNLFPRYPRLAPVSPVRLNCFNEKGKVVKPKTPVRAGFFRRFGKWATSLLSSQYDTTDLSESNAEVSLRNGISSPTLTSSISCKSFYSKSFPSGVKLSSSLPTVKTKTLVKSIAPKTSLKLVKLPASQMREHIKKNSPVKSSCPDKEDKRTRWRAWCKSTMKSSLCGVSTKNKAQKKSAGYRNVKSPGKEKIEEEEKSFLSWGKFDGSFVIEAKTFYGTLGYNKENENRTSDLPLRKSKRKTARRIQFEQRIDIIRKIKSKCQDGIKMVEFPGKGRGVVTTKPFSRGEFVVEYVGELVPHDIAIAREQAYEDDESIGCYMYFFRHEDEGLCVDATEESPYLGRLINHSRQSANLTPRVFTVKSIPHIVLEAKTDLPVGTELLFDYGDRSREAIENHPWLRK